MNWTRYLSSIHASHDVQAASFPFRGFAPIQLAYWTPQSAVHAGQVSWHLSHSQACSVKHKHCYALYIWCGQIIWSQCKGLIRFCDYFLAVGLSFWLVDNLLSYVLSWRMHSWKKERTNRHIALAWRDISRCGTKWLPFHCLRDFLHYSLHRRNSGTCLWNNLPQHVSSVPSLHIFTSRLKKNTFSPFPFQNSFECTVPVKWLRHY